MDGRTLTIFAAAAAIGASFYVLLAPDGKKKKTRIRRDLPPGLMNLGNTCFMNSILQGMAFLPSFISWLQDFSADYGDDKPLTTLAMELKKILKALNNGRIEDDDIIFPDPVLRALNSHGWVIPTEQQDAHEFFHVLSSTLDEEVGEIPGVMNLSDIVTVENSELADDNSMIHRNKVPLSKDCSKRQLPFHGLLASQLVCKRCETKCPVKFDSYDSLSLSLPSVFQIGLTLEDLLGAFVCSETVDSVDCRGCGPQNSAQSASSVRTTFVKRLTFGKLPQCLCIHIQRTYWHTNGIPYKNNLFVKFPEFLDMEPFLYEPLDQSSFKRSKLATVKNGELHTIASADWNGYLDDLVTSLVKTNKRSSSRAIYKLMAVVVHMGSVDDGHYITYRRYVTEQASKWLYTSDELVETSTRDQVLSSCAYMLFYERTGRWNDGITSGENV
ncbi:ubiquitin carboxyl-terminal hydrolase 30-like isoform X1 [Montipora foliosa]|uniref:ubiquitin carboxyl-terminal hydrolase 30-like isoform X1 n=1 Tax=Montipora foliosa TaxID=591990 RepID=UPI0035F13827